MNQCWLIVNWTPTNKLRWILDRYTKHFIHENAFKNVVYEMAVILSINTLGVQICAWWRHQMETFSALLAICAGNSPVPVNSPHKGQWRGALMFTLICARINGWVNNREAGDLRRYRSHYDVIVMWCFCDISLVQEMIHESVYSGVYISDVKSFNYSHPNAAYMHEIECFHGASSLDILFSWWFPW